MWTSSGPTLSAGPLNKTPGQQCNEGVPWGEEPSAPSDPASCLPPLSVFQKSLEEYLQSWKLKRMERIFSIARIQCDDRPTYLSLLEFLVSSACVANLEENYIPT